MKVSVILPTHNRSVWTRRAAESVLQQRYRDYELIVVDDGSDQDMSELQQFLAERGVRYLRVSHRGVAAARNVGVQQSSGSWIAFLDSDDEWFPDKLQRQIEFVKQYPDIEICQSNEEWIRKGRFVNQRAIHAKPSGDAFAACLKLCCISPSSVLLRRTLFDRVGGFDERMRVCEDYDLWLRIAAQYPVGLVEEVLVRKYGGHADQLSRAEPAMDRFRVYALMKLISASLDSEQRRLVFKEILEKSAVLIAGGEKRSNKHYVDLFSRVALLSEQFLGHTASDLSAIEPLLLELQSVIAVKETERAL